MPDDLQMLMIVGLVLGLISLLSWIHNLMWGRWRPLGHLLTRPGVWLYLVVFTGGIFLIAANSEGLLWLGVLMLLVLNSSVNNYNLQTTLKRLDSEHRRDFLEAGEVTIRIREEVLRSVARYVERPYRDDEQITQDRDELQEFIKEVHEQSDRNAALRTFPSFRKGRHS